jgi:hypothetical protein
MFVHWDCMSLIPSIEQATTCVPRSPLTTMTSTVKHLRYIYITSTVKNTGLLFLCFHNYHKL